LYRDLLGKVPGFCAVATAVEIAPVAGALAVFAGFFEVAGDKDVFFMFSIRAARVGYPHALVMMSFVSKTGHFHY
jgi:hypothetical protein